MATAVQGKVPAHKAPVNHEESYDDVDDDDVRSLPPLLLFRRRTRRATRDRGSAGPRQLVHPPFARFTCSEPAPRSASVARVLSETLRSTVTGPSPDPGRGIRLVLFLTHAPPRTRASPPERPRDAGQGHDKVKEDHLLDLPRRPPATVGKVRNPGRPQSLPEKKKNGLLALCSVRANRTEAVSRGVFVKNPFSANGLTDDETRALRLAAFFFFSFFLFSILLGVYFGFRDSLSLTRVTRTLTETPREINTTKQLGG